MEYINNMISGVYSFFSFPIFNHPLMLITALVIGMVVLVYGANFLIDGASGLARRLGIPELIIGLTIVAFGTSMPELVVNLASVAEGATDLAITNVLGSNIINTFVILGLTAFVYPVVSQKSSRMIDIPFSAMAGLLVLTFVFFGNDHTISLVEGIMLLILLVIYFVINFAYNYKNKLPQENDRNTNPMKTSIAVLCIVAGLVMLVVGGELIVQSSTRIARRFGVSEAIIGLTIVALGTSLPELATSVIAAVRKNCDIALGNVLGSNIFNVFAILGTSSVIRDLPAYSGIQLDALVAALGSIMVLMFVLFSKEKKVGRIAGLSLLFVYVVYLAYRLVML